MINPVKKQGIISYILLTWLLCGTLDALSAIVLNLNVPAAAIFRYIAGGFFGKEAAAAGGIGMIIYGILFHYFIALVWTAILFWLYPNFINFFSQPIFIGFYIWYINIHDHEFVNSALFKPYCN